MSMFCESAFGVWYVDTPENLKEVSSITLADESPNPPIEEKGAVPLDFFPVAIDERLLDDLMIHHTIFYARVGHVRYIPYEV